MFKQVHSGWPKAIRSIWNSVNTGPTVRICLIKTYHDCKPKNGIFFKLFHQTRAPPVKFNKSVPTGFCFQSTIGMDTQYKEASYSKICYYLAREQSSTVELSLYPWLTSFYLLEFSCFAALLTYLLVWSSPSKQEVSHSSDNSLISEYSLPWPAFQHVIRNCWFCALWLVEKFLRSQSEGLKHTFFIFTLHMLFIRLGENIEWKYLYESLKALFEFSCDKTFKITQNRATCFLKRAIPGLFFFIFVISIHSWQ